MATSLFQDNLDLEATELKKGLGLIRPSPFFMAYYAVASLFTGSTDKYILDPKYFAKDG